MTVLFCFKVCTLETKFWCMMSFHHPHKEWYAFPATTLKLNMLLFIQMQERTYNKIQTKITFNFTKTYCCNQFFSSTYFSSANKYVSFHNIRPTYHHWFLCMYIGFLKLFCKRICFMFSIEMFWSLKELFEVALKIEKDAIKTHEKWKTIWIKTIFCYYSDPNNMSLEQIRVIATSDKNDSLCIVLKYWKLD